MKIILKLFEPYNNIIDNIIDNYNNNKSNRNDKNKIKE